MNEALKLPGPFIFRRLHSFMGVWLVIYLFYHLLVNSQAGLFFKDEGRHFVMMVDKLENLPFLQAIELCFIALPFFVHIVWGVMYLRTAKMNSLPSDGTKPALYQYKRNRAYSWQRITSWVLIIAVIGHVIHMRFLSAPQEVSEESHLTHALNQEEGYDAHYVVHLDNDAQLKEVAKKLKVHLVEEQGEVLAFSDTPGKGFFLMVRESFKHLYMVILYSIFVIFTCYHAFNGLWTSLITWGITLTKQSQKYTKIAAVTLMWVTLFLGLFSIWGTYLTYAFSK